MLHLPVDETVILFIENLKCTRYATLLSQAPADGICRSANVLLEAQSLGKTSKCCRVLAIVAALFSGAIVLAESTISPQLPNLSVFSLLLHKVDSGQFARSLLTFVLLAYPCMVSCSQLVHHLFGRQVYEDICKRRLPFEVEIPIHGSFFQLKFAQCNGADIADLYSGYIVDSAKQQLILRRMPSVKTSPFCWPNG